MDVILYSTNCPRCTVLKKKLSIANIKYKLVNDAELMMKKGFMSAPILEVDGKAMDFKAAIDWVNNL